MSLYISSRSSSGSDKSPKDVAGFQGPISLKDGAGCAEHIEQAGSLMMKLGGGIEVVAMV